MQAHTPRINRRPSLQAATKEQQQPVSWFSLQEVAGDEEEEAEEEAAVDKQPLLSRGEGVAAEPELLVLREPGDLDALALEEGLCGAARGAPPVVGQLRERQARRHRVRRVPRRLVVSVPARPALVDPRVEHRELLLKPPRVKLRAVVLRLQRRRRVLLSALCSRRRRRRLQRLVVLGDVDGVEREMMGRRCHRDGHGPMGVEVQVRRWWWRSWVLGHHAGVD